MKIEEVFIVIPAYNVADRVVKVVSELIELGYKNIVVIDDGSSKDNTFNALKSFKDSSARDLHLLNHLINRGQGATLQTGQEFALSRGAKYIVHFDGDGQHTATDIKRALDTLVSGGYDIVLGSRFKDHQGKSNVPLRKRLILKLGILFTWMMSGIFLSDTHNGFRVMKAEVVQKLRITQDRYEHASEILDLIVKYRIRYKEIPVEIKYDTDRNTAGQPLSNSITLASNMIYAKLIELISS